MSNLDKFDIPDIKIKTKIDLVLFEQRLKDFVQKAEEELSGKEPEIIFLVLSILKSGQIASMNRKLNSELDRLEEESESLIESLDSNKPETLQKRREIADGINKLLELKDKMSSLLDNLSVVRKMIQIAPKEKTDLATSIADSILSKLHWVAKPDFETN